VVNNTLEIFGLKLTMVGPMWFQNACTVLFLGLFVWSLFWIATDAKRRGKSSFGAVVFAMLALYPISLFWWIRSASADPGFEWSASSLRFGATDR